MGNLNGANDVRNCSDSFEHRLGNIGILDIPCCDLLISKVILCIKKDRHSHKVRSFLICN